MRNKLAKRFFPFELFCCATSVGDKETKLYFLIFIQELSFFKDMPLGQRKDRHKLDHFAKQLVDLGLPAAEVASLHKVVHLLPPPSSGVVQLARPQKVGGVPEEKNFKYCSGY